MKEKKRYLCARMRPHWRGDMFQSSASSWSTRGRQTQGNWRLNRGDTSTQDWQLNQWVMQLCLDRCKETSCLSHMWLTVAVASSNLDCSSGKWYWTFRMVSIASWVHEDHFSKHCKIMVNNAAAAVCERSCVWISAWKLAILNEVSCIFSVHLYKSWNSYRFLPQSSYHSNLVVDHA